jgi:circadian clock protein KaiB
VSPDQPHYHLRLYVAGGLPNSAQAEKQLRDICALHLDGRCTIEVVDLFAAPQRALDDGVIVTPTLVRVEPAPRQVVVGSLTDRAAVMRVLSLEEDR